MKDRGTTDLSWIGKQSHTLRIAVIQPKSTIGMTKENFIRDSYKSFEAALNDIAHPRDGFKHVGYLYLHIWRWSDWTFSTNSYACAEGICINTPTSCITTDTKLKKWLNSNTLGFSLAVECSSCRLVLGTRLKLQELKNLLFHLMLKQMVPELNSGNYFDCRKIKDPEMRGPDQQKEGEKILQELTLIRNLGTIVLAPDILIGGTVGKDKWSEEHALGFTILPGLNLLEGCDGLDEWLRFLVTEKFRQLKQIHKESLPQLIGPKVP